MNFEIQWSLKHYINWNFPTHSTFFDKFLFSRCMCVCCQTMLLCDTYRNPRQWKKKWSQSEQIVDQSYFVSSSACLLGIINHHLPFPNIFCHHKFFQKNIINYLPSFLCACIPEQIEHIKQSFLHYNVSLPICSLLYLLLIYCHTLFCFNWLENNISLEMKSQYFDFDSKHS